MPDSTAADGSTAADHGYCPRCGERLAPPGVPTDQPAPSLPLQPHALARPHCVACGFVRFDDPKLAAGVVAERDGRILLVRRNHEPAFGQWSFPSGFVDRGETVEAAATREAHEEAGVDVVIDALLGVHSSPGNPVVFVAYAATVAGGEPVAGPEAIEVAFFPPDSLPDLAFDHDGVIIEAWRQHRSQQASG